MLSETEQSDTIYGEAAIAYIEANLFEPITVPGIAEKLGFSVSRTYALFRDYTGQTLMGGRLSF